MKVLIIIRKSPVQRYLVHLFTNTLIEEIRNLIGERKYSDAAVAAFKNGVIEREIFENELPNVRADLIITDKAACWDLVGC